MGKALKGKVLSKREMKATQYKHFKGNKAEGQGFADVRKKRVESKYRKMVAKEKRKLAPWRDRLEKIYAETEPGSDDEGHHLETWSKKTEVKGGTGPAESVKGPVVGVTGKLEAVTDQRPTQHKRKCAKKLSSFHRQEMEAECRKQEKQRQHQELERQRLERDAAIQRHKKQKLHAHKLLAKRNYKGQPNLASRMELLLEKITKQRTEQKH